MPGKRPDETYGRPAKKETSNSLLSPGFPGQMGLLAQQMNNGFGGGLLAQRQYLNQIYDPMQMTKQPTFGDDAKTSDTKTTTGGTGDTFDLAPGMERWQRLLYALPNGQQRLQQMQETFQKLGYL